MSIRARFVEGALLALLLIPTAAASTIGMVPPSEVEPWAVMQNPQVTFWIRAFIEADIPGLSLPRPGRPGETMIPGPTPANDCFLTDQRSFSTSRGASSRIATRISVEKGTGHRLSMTSENEVGVTVEVDCEDGDEECRRADDTKRITVVAKEPSADGGEWEYRIAGAANNGCFAGSPDIDFEGSFFVDPTTLRVRFQGRIDAFPSFEVWLGDNGCSFPAGPGTDPSDLPGPANITIACPGR